MRWVVIAAALASTTLLVVLTEPGDDPTVPTPVALPVTTTHVPGGSRTFASLPDGTQFLVTAEPGVSDEWLGSSASIVLDLAGDVKPVGDLTFFRVVRNPDFGYQDGIYRIRAAGLLVVIYFDEQVLRALGASAEEIITSSIRGSAEFGFPVLHLDEPFRWAADEEAPVRMSARFSSFEVRRGCGNRAAVCSPEGSLQVIWRAPEMVSAVPLRQPDLRIFRLVP